MARRKKTHFNNIFAFDVETTGVCVGNNDPLYRESDGERHQALSWGLIIADADTLEPIEKKYIEVKWNDSSREQRIRDPEFGMYAEKIHGLTFDYLEENGIDEEDAVIEIANLILKYWGTSSPLNCLGHNVHFDIRFLKDLLDRYDIDLRFSQRHVDSFAVGFTCWETYDSDELFDLVCGSTRKAHNSLDDIELTLESIRTTRNLFKAMLDGDK